MSHPVSPRPPFHALLSPPCTETKREPPRGARSPITHCGSCHPLQVPPDPASDKVREDRISLIQNCPFQHVPQKAETPQNASPCIPSSLPKPCLELPSHLHPQHVPHQDR